MVYDVFTNSEIYLYVFERHCALKGEYLTNLHVPQLYKFVQHVNIPRLFMFILYNILIFSKLIGALILSLYRVCCYM